MVEDLIRDARLAAGLTQRELARRAGTSQPAIARYETRAAIPTLTTLDRILRACGRRASISAIDVVPERSTSARRRRRVLEAAARHGVRDVRLFGSTARGDADTQSDVDLLVELASGRTLVDLAGFRREVEAILGAPVDVTTVDMLKERARAEVVAEAVPF